LSLEVQACDPKQPADTIIMVQEIVPMQIGLFREFIKAFQTCVLE